MFFPLRGMEWNASKYWGSSLTDGLSVIFQSCQWLSTRKGRVSGSSITWTGRRDAPCCHRPPGPFSLRPHPRGCRRLALQSDTSGFPPERNSLRSWKTCLLKGTPEVSKGGNAEIKKKLRRTLFKWSLSAFSYPHSDIGLAKTSV